MKTISANRQIKKASKLKIDFNQVVYMSSDINYTELHFTDGKKEVFAYTLKLFEDFLGIDGHFIRIHRHFLVNTQFIEMKNRQKVILMTGKSLPIARRRKVEIY